MLLTSQGNSVQFFEKPSYPFESNLVSLSTSVVDGIELSRTRHLVHQQLRVGPISLLNSAYEKTQIRAALKNLGRPSLDSVVVNFNFDYFFLRDIFPRKKIITVINDDFIAQARVPYKRHLVRALRATCEKSDEVLAVSQPLVDQLRQYCNAKLFLPWSDQPYVRPRADTVRNSVLFWGSIDRRLDMELVNLISVDMPDVELHLVGPRERRRGTGLNLQEMGPNVVVMDSTKLSDLPLERYFAAIIPYKAGEKDIEAVTLSNKSLRLLAYGLPLVTHGMPHFLDSGAILKASSHKDFVSKLNVARSNFSAMQLAASSLVNNNAAQVRYEEFMSLAS